MRKELLLVFVVAIYVLPSIALADVIVKDVRISSTIQEKTGHSGIFDPWVLGNYGEPDVGRLGAQQISVSAKMECKNEDVGKPKSLILRSEKGPLAEQYYYTLGNYLDDEDVGKVAAKSNFISTDNKNILFINGESLRGGLIPPGTYTVYAACGDNEVQIKSAEYSVGAPLGSAAIIKILYGAYKPSSGKDFVGQVCGPKTDGCSGSWFSGCSETQATMKCRQGDYCRELTKAAGCAADLFSCHIKARSENSNQQQGTCEPVTAYNKVSKQSINPPKISSLQTIPTPAKDGVTFKITTDRPSYVSIFEVSDDGKRKLKQTDTGGITYYTQVASTGTSYFDLRKNDVKKSFTLSTSHEFKISNVKNVVGKRYSVRIGGDIGEVFMKTVTVGVVPAKLKLLISNLRKTVGTNTATIEFETNLQASASATVTELISRATATGKAPGPDPKLHKIVLTNLQSDSAYDCKITATPGTGSAAEAATADCDFDTLAVADVTAPKIGDIKAVAETDKATITWKTSEASGTFIEIDRNQADIKEKLADLEKNIANLDNWLTNYLGKTEHSYTTQTPLLPGTVYYYRVIARDAAGNEANSGVLKFTTKSIAGEKLPNLMIPDMSFSIAAPKPGENVVATVTVKNSGNADATIQPTASFINLNVGGVSTGIYKVASATTMKAGSSMAFVLSNAPFTFAKEGTRTVSASVNPDNSVKESNTADNVFKKDLVFGTPKLADLTIADASTVPQHPTAGQTASINIIIQNLGNADADFSATNGLVIVKTDDGIQIGNLKGLARAGSSLQLPLSWVPTSDRNYVLTFEADGGNILGESNENNNALSKTVNVLTGAMECNKQTDVALVNKRYMVKNVVLSITAKTNDVLTIKMTQALGTSIEKSEQAQISVGSIGSFFNGGYKVKVVSATNAVAALSLEQCPGTIGGTGITSSGSGILGRVLNGDNFSDPFSGFVNFFKALFGG